VLAYVANFDIALYPRTQDQGIQAAKVAEYMGLGVPTVSYDFRVTEVLRETGAGVLVSTPREFVDAVERLALDEPARTAVAAAARTAGAALDWDVLARRYETEILDRYLRA
jgi:glycosyltransferase involved in cell wall biosynthesis